MEWTLLSNHGHVLACLAQDNRARLRDIAARVGITERAVQKIVHDLEDAGMVEIRKQGRRNHYRLNRRKHLRHPIEKQCSVGQLVRVLGGPGGRSGEDGKASRPAAAAGGASVQKPGARATRRKPVQASDQTADRTSGKASATHSTNTSTRAGARQAAKPTSAARATDGQAPEDAKPSSPQQTLDL